MQDINSPGQILQVSNNTMGTGFLNKFKLSDTSVSGTDF